MIIVPPISLPLASRCLKTFYQAVLDPCPSIPEKETLQEILESSRGNLFSQIGTLNGPDNELRRLANDQTLPVVPLFAAEMACLRILLAVVHTKGRSVFMEMDTIRSGGIQRLEDALEARGVSTARVRYPRRKRKREFLQTWVRDLEGVDVLFLPRRDLHALESLSVTHVVVLGEIPEPEGASINGRFQVVQVVREKVLPRAEWVGTPPVDRFES
jgi:hypothetical protein